LLDEMVGYGFHVRSLHATKKQHAAFIAHCHEQIDSEVLHVTQYGV